MSSIVMRALTRFHPRLISSLVYMLQASEYEPERYSASVRRTTDFRAVQKRKRLRYTPKAKLLLSAAWLIAAAWIIAVASFTLSLNAPFVFRIFALMLGVAALPFALPRAMLAPLFLLRMAQAPIERYLIKKAQRKIQQLRAVKIAIAGSYGKTTMKEILRTVLSDGKKIAATPGNANTPIGISRFVETLRGDEEVLIFEFGEYYSGDIAALCELVEPDIGVITGVNEAHLERFKIIDRTTKTIFELAEYLGERPLFVNGESSHAAQAAAPRHRLYSRQGVAHWRVNGETTGIEGTRFTLSCGAHKIEATSGLLGMHQIGPLAAAAVIAFELGLSVPEIEQGTRKTRAFEHRLEPRRDAGGVVTIDDTYNGNPDGARAAIEFLRCVDAKRRIYVTPGLVEMGERSAAVHEEIGRSLAKIADVVVLVANSATPHIARGLTAALFKGELLWYDDALQMYAALPMLTVAGDVVLLQNDWPDGYV
ncbi:MAG: UDP-N-acetylmuramoyl-tripeptide--D-alanyl-D-alanine ligase [bacterium]|nr:UDP-N-acetylmuramoyl-tripeptide--D-alanyl-D-alanine ligase [bacterium]MDZ4284714.1 UDP-N-acetylmuramoyl-tripeptide--D-alanyl-D-alanine ligase [Patescibacteria group bacterium]